MKTSKLSVLAAGLVLGMCVGSSAQAACVAHVGRPAADTSMLQVKSSSMDVSGDAGHRMVTSLGTITNPSANCFQNVVLELQFFDAARNHVDTVVEPMEGLLIPAGETVAFRVRESASREAASYATQSVRLVDADVRWVKPPESPRNAIVDVLMAWGPMLLLIAIWIFVMRRYSGKRSPQATLIANSELQIKATQELVTALQRVAIALERPRG